MKTLDEVIDYLEGKQACGEWPGIGDAIHYLKGYRILQSAYIYVKAMTDIEDNPSLTWDELKQMEGKPVWVETDNVKFWTVVDNFRTICNQECLCCSKGYMCRSTHTRGDWHAYRKERTE